MLKPVTSAAVTSSDDEAVVATKRTSPEPSSVANGLIIRGRMMLVGEWDLIVFLCTPVYDSFDITTYFYPASGRGTVYCFRAISFFLSLSATLRENGWTDLHEIFREGVDCGVTMGRPD